MFETLTIGIAALWQQSSGITYHEEDIYLSETPIEITAPIEFTALGITGQEALPELFFRANEESEWRAFHRDEEYPLSTEILTGNPRTKLSLKSTEPVFGKITLIDTRLPAENLVARFDPFDDDSGDNPLTGLSNRISVMPPEYISREDWKANEDLRVWKPFRGLSSYFREIVPEAKQLPRKKRPKIIAKKDAKGRQLTWPVEENQVIEKFIIHHTGEVIDESRQPNEIMRAIYAFHTLTRGWGDIGYHYVIDSKGNIYEGRAGGPKTVGAHTAYHNVGSIGIALMGNFEREDPTTAQLEVLTLLLAEHANRFDINPTGRNEFLGKNSYNISGHRDVARRGHGTACPGEKLHKKLDWIRKETATKAEMLKGSKRTGRDFLAKSKKAKKYQKAKVFVRKEKIPAIAATKLTKKKILKRGEKTILEIEIRNGSKFDWPKGAVLEVKNLPDEGILISKFRSINHIPAGRTGKFRARIQIKEIPNGIYELILIPRIFNSNQNIIYEKLPIAYPIQISGDKNQLMTRYATKMKTAAIKPHRNIKATSKVFSKEILKKTNKTAGPEIKVKLAHFDKKIAYFKSLNKIDVWSKNKKEASIPGNTLINVVPSDHNNKVTLSFGKTKLNLTAPELKTDGIIKITNYNYHYGKINYNSFRKQINIHLQTNNGNKKLLLVNQLPLEEYLWGLGEEPSSEPTEKKHAIHILARSYGLVYSGTKRKFKTALYDLEDSPKTSQLYLGYEWEKYHPDQKKLIKTTQGQVITYEKKPVIGPYFTQSSGWSSDAWQHQYPWTKAQELTYDKGLDQKGHGIGLSGNTARMLAKEGKSYKEIINYFFEGIKIEKKY